jgi:hypothetical protein
MSETQPIRNRWVNRIFVILMVVAAFAAAIGGSIYLLGEAKEAGLQETVPADSSATEQPLP